jgi:hypothetical protein
MLFWYLMLTLMADAIRVIEMWLQLIALGKGTSDEIAIILRGGDPSIIIENYRKIIVANAARLSIVTERRTRAAVARWKGTYVSDPWSHAYTS